MGCCPWGAVTSLVLQEAKFLEMRLDMLMGANPWDMTDHVTQLGIYSEGSGHLGEEHGQKILGDRGEDALERPG